MGKTISNTIKIIGALVLALGILGAAAFMVFGMFIIRTPTIEILYLHFLLAVSSGFVLQPVIVQALERIKLTYD